MFGSLPHWLGLVSAAFVFVLVLAFYVAVIAGIIKIFEIHRDVKELKAKLLGAPAPRSSPPQA